MSENMIKIVDCSTGEEIERDLTDAEIKSYNDCEKLRLEIEARTVKRNLPKVTAKAALLDKLGITAEEAVLLLS
jgi:hypothetical protein